MFVTLGNLKKSFNVDVSQNNSKPTYMLFDPYVETPSVIRAIFLEDNSQKSLKQLK